MDEQNYIFYPIIDSKVFSSENVIRKICIREKEINDLKATRAIAVKKVREEQNDD